MDNGFINFADIKVVPNFKTNDNLARSICSKLNSHLKKKAVIGNQPSQGPAFLVFRPSGRAGDEFKDHVTPLLKEGSLQYLIIASSTKPTATFGISEDDKKRLHHHQTRVVVNQGKLVAPDENYHDYNSDSLKKLIEAIREDYSDLVEQVEEDVTKNKGLFSGLFHRSSSKKDLHGPVPEAIGKKKQGHSEIPIRWLSIVGQSLNDVEMASHLPESSSSVQTMARNTAVGQCDLHHETTMHKSFVNVQDYTEDEIVGIRATSVKCIHCGTSIQDDDELVQCSTCNMKQKRMRFEWMCCFQNNPKQLYSVSSDVMMKCLEGTGFKQNANEIKNFLLKCGKIRFKPNLDNEMAFEDEGSMVVDIGKGVAW